MAQLVNLLLLATAIAESSNTVGSGSKNQLKQPVIKPWNFVGVTHYRWLVILTLLYSVQFTVYSMQCTVCSVHCVVHIVQRTVYSV